MFSFKSFIEKSIPILSDWKEYIYFFNVKRANAARSFENNEKAPSKVKKVEN